MSRIASIAKFVVFELGPLLLFWILVSTAGLRWAIAGSIAAIIADALWRRWNNVAFTRLYLLISAMTLAFGAIDLLSVSPFMLKYESVATNLATAAAFVVGALGEKPLIQDVAEQRQGEAFQPTPEIQQFFRLFTLAWAVYFVAKAALYFWFARTMPLLEAMAFRSAIGGASLGVMILISATQGRRLFFLCRRLGFLPKPPPSEKPPA